MEGLFTSKKSSVYLYVHQPLLNTIIRPNKLNIYTKSEVTPSPNSSMDMLM